MRKHRGLKKLILSGLIVISTVEFSESKSYASLDDINFNNINIEQGVSKFTVESVFQDSKGYIWLGTTDGLNRYNGYDCKIYTYEENENSISDNGITDIAEDNKKNIWVGTVNGINKIQPTTGKITNYTESNNTIIDDSISSVICTKDNKILATTHTGLSIYNENTNRFDVVLDKSEGMLSSSMNYIDEDRYGNLWISTELGVNKVSKDFKVLESYPINMQEKYIGDSEISVLYCDDKHNAVWVGTCNSGLYKIDTKTKNITEHKNDIDNEYSIPSNKIESIMRDSSDRLWVGTTKGLARYNEKDDDFDIYTNKVYDRNSLIYDDVRSLMEDNEGIIWVGTYSGISIFDTKSTIKHYKSGLDQDNLLSENMIQGIYEDSEGYLWVGTKSKGVNIINREKNTFKYLNSKTNKMMNSDYISDITGQGDLVFIATDKGVLKLDKKNNTMKNFTTKDGLVSGNVNDILLDDKGYLWIGTSSGISLLDIKNDKILDTKTYINDNLYVRHMYQDSEGNYYLGLLKDGGLCVINSKTKDIKYYKNEQGNEDSISSNRVRYINEDKKGNIWIGTDYGLNKFNKKTGKFKRYTTKNGLANNTIYGIIVDDKDDIWISTNRGISKINTDTKKIQNLSITDGIQGNEFNSNASYKNDKGELFFGGINGLNTFCPDDIKKTQDKPEVLFDSFEVNDKEYSDINNLKFSEKTDTIKIKFFTPRYSSRKQVLYEYNMIGTSGGKSCTKDNHITYNDLPPGKYTFEIRAIDTNGYIGNKSYVTFTIKPIFWFSPIAYVIYVGIILFHIIKYKNKMKKLDELVKERTKLLSEEMERNTVLLNENIKLEKNKNSYFVNLSHELRTPLNVISSTNQLIMGLMKKGSYITEEKLSHYIDVSQKNCHRLLNLINNILDGTKLQNKMYKISLKEADIVYLVEETALTLADYIKAKGIELIIDPEVEEKNIICDPYEIERCVINLIGNAAKFTPEGGSITVTVKDLEDRVMISVLDTGVGIDEKYHKIIFDRFNQVVDEKDEVKCGSGLGLTITSHIVKLHKGDIYVKSTPGEGSNFVIILPSNLNNAQKDAVQLN